jgi:sulfur carrier protein ThiS
MAHVTFPDVIQRHVTAPPTDAEGATVREVLEQVFRGNEPLRSYLLDDQGGLRKHLALFVDGQQVRDRQGLNDTVGAESQIHVLQALSGG